MSVRSHLRVVNAGCCLGAVITTRNAHAVIGVPMVEYDLAYVFNNCVNNFNRETMDSCHNTSLNAKPRQFGKEVEMERNASNDEGTNQAVEIVEQKVA